MKTSKLIIPAPMCLLLLTGCVSTTTGSITEPARNEKVAAELNYQLGVRYYKKGNFRIARDRLLLATELDPQLAKAYTTLALTYEALENQRLARKAYEMAIRVAPRDFDVQNTYACLLSTSPSPRDS